MIALWPFGMCQHKGNAVERRPAAGAGAAGCGVSP